MLRKIGMKMGVVALGLMLMSVSVWAIEITDYKDPELFYQDAFLRANFSLDSGNRDQTEYKGAAALDYYMEYSTLPLKWRISALGDMDISRGPNENDSTEENYRIRDESTYTTVQYYPRDPYKFFGFAKFNFGIRKLEKEIEADDDPYAKISGGVGYGRIITATPLMEAYRIVEDLTKYGIITKKVSDKGYLDLAYVIAKRAEFKAKYGLRDYEKYWYIEMEKVLQKEGVLKDNIIGVMGTLKIKEIMDQEQPLYRRHGWEVGAGLGYLISDYPEGSEENDPTLDAYLEYNLPIGFKWQITERLDYSTILDSDLDHMFVNVLSANYEITDKIDWMNSWRCAITLYSGDEDNAYDNTLQTSLRFFISNTVDFTTGLKFHHFDQGDNKNDDIETRFFFTVEYTIL